MLKLPLVEKSATANDANAREGGTLFWKAGTGFKPGSVIGIDMAKPGSSLAGNIFKSISGLARMRLTSLSIDPTSLDAGRNEMHLVLF